MLDRIFSSAICAMTESEQLAKLRAFADCVLDMLNTFVIDIDAIFESARNNGLLEKVTNYVAGHEHPESIMYRKTPLLTGESNDEG